MVYIELRASLAYEILPEFDTLFFAHGTIKAESGEKSSEKTPIGICVHSTKGMKMLGSAQIYRDYPRACVGGTLLAGAALLALGARVKMYPLPCALLTSTGAATTALALKLLMEKPPSFPLQVRVEQKKMTPAKTADLPMLLDLSKAPLNILSHTFSFLDFDSLKEVCLTCKSWKSIANPCLAAILNYTKKIQMQTPSHNFENNFGLLYIQITNHQIAKKWTDYMQIGDQEPFRAGHIERRWEQQWHCDGKSIVALTDHSTCSFDDGTQFSCPRAPAYSVFLYQSDVFIGSMGAIHRCSSQGEVLETWNLDKDTLVHQIYVDDRYVVARTGGSGFKIFNRFTSEKGFTVFCSLGLYERICVYQGALFFSGISNGLHRVDLSSGTHREFPLSGDFGVFSGIWHQIAFFSHENKITLFYYPTSNIITELNCIRQPYSYSSALDENAGTLTLYYTSGGKFSTYKWTL